MWQKNIDATTSCGSLGVKDQMGNVMVNISYHMLCAHTTAIRSCREIIVLSAHKATWPFPMTANVRAEVQAAHSWRRNNWIITPDMDTSWLKTHLTSYVWKQGVTGLVSFSFFCFLFSFFSLPLHSAAAACMPPLHLRGYIEEKKI